MLPFYHHIENENGVGCVRYNKFGLQFPKTDIFLAFSTLFLQYPTLLILYYNTIKIENKGFPLYLGQPPDLLGGIPT